MAAAGGRSRDGNRAWFSYSPQWYTELCLGVGFLAFAAITVYPFRGTTTELALLVGIVLSALGGMTLLHAARLGRNVRWRWIVNWESPLVHHGRAAIVIILFLTLSFVGVAVDFTEPTPTLKPSWWLIAMLGVAFDLLIVVWWWSKTHRPDEGS